MIRHKRLLILLWFLYIQNHTYSQSHVFYENNHEISTYNYREIFHYDIDDIFIDEHGQLWFLNLDKIVRYDGIEFDIHLIDEQNRVNNLTRQYSKLTKDSKGNMWMTSGGGGIVKYNPYEQSYQRVHEDSTYMIGGYGYDIVEDSNGFIWAGYSEGLLRIEDGKPFSVEKIQIPSIASELRQFVDKIERDGKTIEGILKVRNDQSLSKNFSIKEDLEIFVLAQGELDVRFGKLAVTGRNWEDYGWIENKKGETVWSMESVFTYSAGKLNKSRIAADIIFLERGEYSLHFKTNKQFAYGDWKFNSEFENNFSPAYAEWWGIQLFSINPVEKDSLKLLKSRWKAHKGLGSNYTNIYKDKDSIIWVYGEELQMLNSFEDGDFEFQGATPWQKDRTEKVFSYIGGIHDKNKDNLWISGLNQKGEFLLGILNKRNGEFREVQTNIQSGRRAVENLLDQIIQDPKGNLWLGGLYSKGIHKIVPPFSLKGQDIPVTQKSFSFTDREPGRSRQDIYGIKSFDLDSSQNLWISTWRNDFYKLKINELPFQVMNAPELGLGKENLFTMFLSRKNRFWMGITRYQGKEVSSEFLNYNIASKQIIKYEGEIYGQPFDFISALAELPNNQLLFQYWHNGLKHALIVDEDKESLQSYPWENIRLPYSNRLTHNFMVNDSLLFTNRGQLINTKNWGLHTDFNDHLSGTFNNTLYMGLLSRAKDIWVVRNFGQIGRFSLENNQIKPIEIYDFDEIQNQDIVEDFQGNIWVSCHQLRSNLGSKEFRSVYDLPESVGKISASKLLADRDGGIWLLSEKGISRFDPKTGQVIQPQLYSNIKVSEISKTQDGGAYILDHEQSRFYYFHPDSFQIDTFASEVVIRSLEASGEEDDIRFDLSWSKEEKIPAISYDLRDIAISYSGLQYNGPAKVTFAYYLEGNTETWQEVGNERIARFFNLRPGTYTFRVKAANADGIWGKPKSIIFTIKSPWWASDLAILIYFLVVFGLTILGYRFILNRRLEQEEARRIKELDQVKSRLYNNITHEFRTPLTLIDGMLNKVEEEPEKWLNRGVNVIRKNGGKLLNLVNQMLDLSKLESGQLKLAYIQSDIISHINFILDPYVNFADSEGIQLNIHSELESLEMDFDPKRLEEIIGNLVANSLKFTDTSGKIDFSMSREDESFLFKVTDTGIGIPQDELAHVFDRFYQGKNSNRDAGYGTGIGLSICYELVKLMQGSISVKSVRGEGSSFLISLPIKKGEKTKIVGKEVLQRNRINPDLIDIPGLTQESNNFASDKASVLIVEDNQDVSAYLKICLEAQYQIHIANDGQEGIKKATELVPDLIISDVMMPGQDGFELCQTLKEDIRTSHIPITLLTAKVNANSKLEGLGKGADAYITKPFLEEELLLTLRNQLEARNKLHEKYRDLTGMNLNPNYIRNQEDRFILKFKAFVLTNLENADLDVTIICDELGITRTPLHNKLKALTGMSTTEFVRYIRLTQALELMQDADLNVSEIAYRIGFGQVPYFNRKFKELYGKTPKEMMEVLKSN